MRLLSESVATRDVLAAIGTVRLLLVEVSDTCAKRSLQSEFDGLNFPTGVNIRGDQGNAELLVQLSTDFGNVLYASVVMSKASDLLAEMHMMNVEKAGNMMEAMLGWTELAITQADEDSFQADWTSQFRLWLENEVRKSGAYDECSMRAESALWSLKHWPNAKKGAGKARGS